MTLYYDIALLRYCESLSYFPKLRTVFVIPATQQSFNAKIHSKSHMDDVRANHARLVRMAQLVGSHDNDNNGDNDFTKFFAQVLLHQPEDYVSPAEMEFLH